MRALSELRGVGPSRLEALQRAGIDSLEALVRELPRAYRDLSDRRTLDQVKAGEEVAVEARVIGRPMERRVGKLLITKVRVEDEWEQLSVVWYNQPWMKNQLAPGRRLLLYGRVESRYGELTLVCPALETGEGLKPVYRSIEGIPSKMLSQLIEQALEAGAGQTEEELPEEFRRRYGLCERACALRNAHRPASREALEAARRRLTFEELLIYQVALGLMRGNQLRGVRIESAPAEAEAYWQGLGFAPTSAQRRVLVEILGDLASPAPMARMVQGDVGCGKTAIAFGALAVTAQHGFQGALMAPTEILAAQHFESAQRLLEPLGLKCGLLTGSLTARQRQAAREAVASGAWNIVIGTHALISEGVAYQNLGLVITDEQHRFGVKQRTMLGVKGERSDSDGAAVSPNVLVMSATPIPRSLALILYGDLDLSIVDELPPGRTPVKTKIVPEAKRKGMYGFLREQVRSGRQVYVVCPLVEESEAVDALPAQAVYEQLRSDGLKGLRIGLAHGRMRPQDKEEVLSAFHAGELDVLVATTVIEVGINVPNATVMVVENAERFGLAQLHQLRGRVGRGSAESWCFLMAEPNERLKLMTQTSDGFVIAQKDMEMRGPGELLGERQSGLAQMTAGALMADTALLKETHDAARGLLARPDGEEARQVMALARRAMAARLHEVAMN